jgi:glycosyltransferase involved in cell wall biosynthesis
MSSYQLGFIMEQALGHVTHTRNLQAVIPQEPGVQAHWGLIPFEREGLAARIPGYGNWTVRAGVRARRAVARIARRTPLDALLFHTQVPAILATDWVRRVPSVISLDATPLQYDRLGQFYEHRAGPAWLEGLKWRLNRDCFRAAGHLVTWSAWARDGLAADYEVPPSKVTVIPPGVDVAAWARPARRQGGDGPARILFVGGNLERKGGLLLIDAFRALRAAGSPVELHLVTHERAAPAEGLFVYNGMRPNSPELKQLYHRCDIFCLPTLGDCLPMVLSEAGAAGLPAVTTAVAAIPEIVADGESGLLVPPGDGAALAAALRRLLDHPDLRLRLGERAVEIVRARFDARANARRLLALLKAVAEQGRAHRRRAA